MAVSPIDNQDNDRQQLNGEKNSKNTKPNDVAEALLGNEGLSPPKFDEMYYKDFLFSILFYINVVIISALGLSKGLESLSYIGPSITIFNKDGGKSVIGNRYENSKVVMGIFIILLTGASLSVGWIYLLSRMANKLINITFGVILSVTIISGFSMLIAGLILYGIILLMSAFVSVIFFSYVRTRLIFAGANLKVACEAIKLMPSTILAAAAVLGLELLFCLLWMLAAMGEATNESVHTISSNGKTYDLSHCSTYQYSSPITIGGVPLACTSATCSACVCDTTVVYQKACLPQTIYQGSYFLLLLSLFWVSAVLSNVVHCTTSGAVSAWWFTTESEMFITDVEGAGTWRGQDGWRGSKTIHEGHRMIRALCDSNSGITNVSRALKRSLTTSFGSICLGSLAVAILRLTRTIVAFTTDQLRTLHNTTGISTGSSLRIYILSTLDFVLKSLDRVMGYFNRYAFCYVAIYGLDFLQASHEVVKMFSDRGWSALLNDDIIDGVLLAGHIMGGIICMLIGYAYSKMVNVTAVNTTMLTSLGFFSGFLMFTLTMKVVSSAVATVYVCFAENPTIFEETHPALYRELNDAWSDLSRGGTGGTGAPAIPQTNPEKKHSPYGNKTTGGWNTYNPPGISEPVESASYRPLFAEENEGSPRIQNMALSAYQSLSGVFPARGGNAYSPTTTPAVNMSGSGSKTQGSVSAQMEHDEETVTF
mmetsp:Transcript_13092/g.12687  ORF Transcript_13092/g.12687 Transcript_13092/m.12687 type:complete len:707 (+) Transcript_13092:119-2239(+)|eukprot:CAMPEP_0119051524 /NCGR_PEP_ID=MMETSP1177-20130426/73108_1 /TAXON_ID=2985 /ORGANISM="Ochromonas sp, Strain CCMP1899" /LENGTH=706 /DNA_ID=CAMNT_0007030747 /DNA_START=35 /DNA_END=2155 /DNA_ORIENTATION=+